MKLGLLLSEIPSDLESFIRVLGRHVVVVDGHHHHDCAAYLTERDQAPPVDRPLVGWAPDGVPHEGAVATLVPARAQSTDSRVHRLPRGDAGVGVLLVAPFTRQRIRQARGLSDDVAELRDGKWRFGSRWLEPQLADTCCAVAAGVSVTGPEATLRACAWGAPLVTDQDTAAAIGLNSRAIRLAADPEARLRLAEGLAADPIAAARASRASYRLVDKLYSPDRSAARILACLPLGTTMWSLQGQLSYLGTPASATIRTRVEQATFGLRDKGDSR